MAKLKLSPRSRSNQQTFELTGNLFESLPDYEIHPSISDFVIETRARNLEKLAAGHSSPSSLEIGQEFTASPTENLTLLTFGSGSSGNCAYLGTASCGILIDAGVNADTVRDSLRRHGINPRAIKGIVLTHDHTDHVKYVYPLVKKRPDIGVYCTPKTLSGLLRRHSISRRIKDYHRPIYKEFAFKIGPFDLTPFEVSHDGTDNVGYFIECGNSKIALATDLGCITPRVDFYMRQANHIVIESNYDQQMLINGPYPMHLKARIAADNGHLDNAVTAEYLAGIASEKLRNIFLCHLSQDNNLPTLAYDTVKQRLNQAGINVEPHGTPSFGLPPATVLLSTLPRTETSSLFTLK